MPPRRHFDDAMKRGMAMLGYGALDSIPVRGAKDATALLQVQANYPNTPIHVYFVASGIADAAATGAQLIELEPESTFIRAWHQCGPWLPLNQPIVEKLSFKGTETLKALRSETLILDWDAELSPLVVRSPARESRAFAAFTKLRSRLRLSVKEAALFVGVGKTTPVTSWKREGHEPQPRKARRLYQLDALVDSVFRQLGSDAAFTWLHAGSPSPFELMKNEDLSAAADLVERLVMRKRLRTSPAAGSDVAPADSVAVIPSGKRRAAEVKRRS